MENRLEYLESRVPSDVDINDKYGAEFDRTTRYRGNGVYEWRGNFGTDTREVFLLGVLDAEGIHYKKV